GEVGLRQCGERITRLGAGAAGIDSGIRGVRKKSLVLAQPAGRDAGGDVQVFGEIGAGRKVQIIGVIIGIKGHAAGQRVGDLFVGEPERIVPGQGRNIVVEIGAGVAALNYEAAVTIFDARKKKIGPIVDGLGKFLTETGSSAGAGAGVQDGADGPGAVLVFTEKAAIDGPIRRELVIGGNGATFAPNFRRGESCLRY